MNWKQQWINRVLGDIPASSYRTRAEAELRDHLETQFRALTEDGWTQNKARSETLRTMGEPEKLQEEYKAAWQRTLESKLFGSMICLLVFLLTSILMYGLYTCASVPMLLTGVLFEEPHIWEGSTLLYKAFVIAAGSLTFLIPYTLEAAVLRLCFQRFRHRAALITTYLLGFWAISNSFLILAVAAIDEINQYQHMSMVEMIAHFYNRLPYSNAPWITPLYHLLTFLGCILLGHLFGRIPVEERKKGLA